MDLTNCVVLDTETTGLDKAAEVCEISLIDGKTGLVLLDTLVRPTIKISDGAAKVHGITNEMVADAPTWGEIHDLVVRLLKGVTVVIYQEDFDVRLMRQSARANECRMPALETVCAMRYVTALLTTPKNRNPRWPKLTAIAEDYGVIPRGTAHRALCDTHLTRDVLLAIRAEDQQDRLYRDATRLPETAGPEASITEKTRASQEEEETADVL